MANVSRRNRGWFIPLTPLLVVIGLLFLLMHGGGDERYNPLALVAGSLVAMVIGRSRNASLRGIWRIVLTNCREVFPTLLFLGLIGATSVAWSVGGIIPTMVYYGIKYLSPKIFLVATAFFTALMALACGSSWLTVGTMGAGFLGIGNLMGFSAPLVAGAVISGAYFGDKLTPMSETTVLAASMTKTPLLCHVRYMLLTSVPCFLVTLCLFGLLGAWYGGHATETGDGTFVMGLLEQRFRLSPLLLLIPIQVMGFTLLGCSPTVILAVNVLLSMGIGLTYQSAFLGEVLGDCDFGWLQGCRGLARRLFWGMDIADDDPVMVKLLSSGGICGMWPTIAVILGSLLLSSAMEGTGLLNDLMNTLSKRSPYGMLVCVTSLGALFFNIALADQYLAIILTSKIFLPLFTMYGLASENLSRAVEDTATVTSPLIPWNTCGAAQAKALHVRTLDYLPYCFFNLLSPLFSMAYHFLGIKITRRSPKLRVEKNTL